MLVRCEACRQIVRGAEARRCILSHVDKTAILCHLVLAVFFLKSLPAAKRQKRLRYSVGSRVVCADSLAHVSCAGCSITRQRNFSDLRPCHRPETALHEHNEI